MKGITCHLQSNVLTNYAPIPHSNAELLLILVQNAMKMHTQHPL